MIELLKRIWFNINGQNIPVYGIPKPNKDLRDFTTTEKDMKKHISKHPTNDYRILSEDMFDLSGSQASGQ